MGALILRRGMESEVLQPEAIFVYNNQQYRIPLKKIYIGGTLYEFEDGLEAGIFVYPLVPQQANGGISMNPNGAALFLSYRTVNSGVARYYLFGEESDYIKLAHTETNYFVENLRGQGVDMGEFVQYQGFQGPIKIWEISYPEDIEFREEFLEKDYPDENLMLAKEGEY